MANARSVIINLVANDRVTDTVKGIGKSFDKLNGQVKKMAAPAMAAAGAAAGAALVGGITNAIQLDSARGKLEAQLGLTKTQSKTVGQAAGKLYSRAYGESMEDVQGAITSVVRNMDGLRTASQAALQETTARAMNTATVMDEEVGGVTKAVAQMLKTGLAKNAQEAFDILVAGTQRGANKAEDLLDTFNEYGTQFRKLGLDGKTAMGLIQQGLQGGARDADLVADAFKEFSIRAIDGSDSTIAGFKALGLNASQMAKQIAAGGPAASKGLDAVLDRLRAIKDPVKQAQVAVELFGTQAEDLGKALYSLDPSKATTALGRVAGATDAAGKSLQTNQAKFEAFKRTLVQNISGALVRVVSFFQQHTTVAKVLAGVVGTLTAAYAAYNAVALVMAARTALMTQGTAAHLIVTKLARGATLAWTAVQWLLNAALTANPIGLVVVAIAALIAGIVLAYKHSDTFRNIVNTAWAAIKNAVMTAWAVIKPIFMQIANVLLVVVGTALKWYWAYVKFVFTTVWTIIQFAWAIIKPIFNAIAATVRAVLGVAFIVFQNLIKVVWIAIQIYIKVAWAIIKGYFAAMKWYVTQVLAPIFMWLYNNVVKPVWNAIRAAIATQWAVIKGIWNGIKSFLSTVLGPAFKVFKTVAGAAWTGLKVVISGVVSNIKTVFNGLKTAVGAVKNAFKTAVDGIKSIWNSLKSATKTPVNFVIGLYNDGLVKLVNGIAGLAGIKTRLSKIPKFATGGIMPGYAPGRDSLVAAVSPGEAIMRPEWTRAVGPGAIAAMNGIARKRGPKGVRDWMAGGEGMAFARGGVVPGYAGQFGIGGVVGGFLKGAKDFAFDNVEKVAKATLDKVISAAVPGQGLFRDVVAKIPEWIKTNVWGWLKKNVGAVGGKGFKAALSWAKTQAGKAYQWGGNGNPSWDCSGFMSAIESVIRGEKPHRRWATSSFNGGTPPGWKRGAKSGFQIGVLDNGNAHASHTAGTLLGTNVESSGSGGVRVGGGARGYKDSMFPWQYGFKADTGALALAPGWNPPVFNGTGRPEYLETPRAGDGGLTLCNHGVIGSRQELQNWLTRSLADLKQRGRI